MVTNEVTGSHLVNCDDNLNILYISSSRRENNKLTDTNVIARSSTESAEDPILEYDENMYQIANQNLPEDDRCGIA